MWKANNSEAIKYLCLQLIELSFHPRIPAFFLRPAIVLTYDRKGPANDALLHLAGLSPRILRIRNPEKKKTFIRNTGWKITDL